MSDVAAPATGVWYDLDVTTSEVLAILRLTEQDVDVERIQTLVPAAALLIDEYLDRPDVVDGPPPSAKLQQALDQATVELYRRKDVSTSGFVAVTSILAPLKGDLIGDKQRWGVA